MKQRLAVWVPATGLLMGAIAPLQPSAAVLGVQPPQRCSAILPTVIASGTITAKSITIPTVCLDGAEIALRQPALPGKQVFQTRIKRREAGTPIIEVTFNGHQTFEMIVDTGAGGTVITQTMARTLGIVPQTKARYNTANAQGIELSLGYINTMEVGGATARDLLVAIAGPELPTGLLGHDFFGDYDIVITKDVVEFRTR